MIKQIKWSVLFRVVFIIWLSVQAVLLFLYWDLPCHDDALYYEELALGCIDAGTWYPALHNLHDVYAFAPGYVNLLIGVHLLFGTFSAICFLNLVMNVLLVFEVFLLGKRLFGENVGFISAIAYMLMYSNLYVPIAHQSDLPFTFLLVSSLLLCMNKRMYWLLIAGVLIGLANWIRPLAVVFLITILVYFVVQKRAWFHYAALLMPLALTIFLIGMSAKQKTGYFVYQSTTGGVNLAMSSFDEANGLVNFDGLKDSTNSICLKGAANYTFMERDKALKKAAIEWILENPLRYIAQVPLKVVALYCEDTWSERIKPDMGFGTILPKIKEDKMALAQLGVTVFIKSLTYYLVIFFFLYYLWVSRRELFRKQNVFLLIPLLGTAMTVAVVVTSRYHYPYLFMMTIYAAKGINHFISNRYSHLNIKK